MTDQSTPDPVPTDALAERGFALIEEYDENQNPETAHAAHATLTEVYRRDGPRTDPDVAVVLARCRARCAELDGDPATLGDALAIIDLAILPDRNNFDARSARAEILAVKARFGDEDASRKAAGEARSALAECPTRHWVSCAGDLCDILLLRYAVFDHRGILDELHDVLDKICRRKAGRGHPDFLTFAGNRAIISRDIAALRRDRSWASRAVRDACFLVRHAPHEPGTWTILSAAFLTIGELTSQPRYLLRARDALVSGLSAVARSDSARLHETLSRNLQSQYNWRGGADVLEQAEYHAALAVRLEGGVTRCSAWYLMNWAVCLNRCADVREDPRWQQRATRYARESLKKVGGQQDPDCRANAGLILLGAFDRLGERAVLDEAIEHLAAATAFEPEESRVWLNLVEGVLTRSHAVVTPDESDLDAAAAALDTAEALLDGDSPHRATILAHRSEIRRARFTLSGDLNDLRSACAFADESVELCPRTDPDRVRLLHGAAQRHRDCYELGGNLHDLQSAARHVRAALKIAPAGHSQHGDLKVLLATIQLHTFERTGRTANLDKAVATATSAAEHYPSASTLAALASCRLRVVELTGDLDLLDAAVITAEDACNATQQPESKSVALHNLGNALLTRYELVGELSDLKAARTAAATAVTLTPPTSALLPSRRSGLGNVLRALAEATRNRKFLEQAVYEHQQACRSALPSDRACPAYRSNLALALADRGDSAAAVMELRRAVTMSSEIERDLYRANLAMALREHAPHSASPDASLDEAIDVLRDVTRGGRSTQAGEARLLALGNALHERYERHARRDDLNASRRIWRRAAGDRSAHSWARLMAAENLASSLADDAQWPQVVQALESALHILPALAWHGLGWESRELHLSDRPPLGSLAGSAALNCTDPERAVELIEAGRGLSWARWSWKQEIGEDGLPEGLAADLDEAARQLG